MQIRISIRGCIRLSVRPSVCPSVHPSICASGHPSVRPSVCQFLRADSHRISYCTTDKQSNPKWIITQSQSFFTVLDASCLSVRPSICPYVRPSICPFFRYHLLAFQQNRGKSQKRCGKCCGCVKVQHGRI